jgi:hypothetical protein
MKAATGLFFDLKMEMTSSCETSVDFQQTTWCYIPEDRALHNHHSENVKSYTFDIVNKNIKQKGGSESLVVQQKA